MTTRLAIEAANYRLKRETLLEQYPDLAADEEALLDTLEGLTDVHEQLAALLRSAVEDEALADGLHEYQAKLADRKSIMQARAIRKRRIALRYMSDLDIKKIVSPDMTITRKPVPPSVLIIDITLIPEAFTRVRREPDKVALKAALAEGEVIPGAALSNGGETLAVRI
jgi:hypothetical protein